MLYLLIKAGLSGVIVELVSETARRSPGLGALLASLALISILGMIWIWNDTGCRAADSAFARDLLVRAAVVADVPPDPRIARAWHELRCTLGRRVPADLRAVHRNCKNRARVRRRPFSRSKYMRQSRLP